MSDHAHYEYASERHDHRGDYADQRHDHDIDYAEKHHRHYDDESAVRGLREDLGHAEERIRELERDLRDALERIRALEDRQPDYADDEPEPVPEVDDEADRSARERAYIGRRVIQAALVGSDATREDVARTVAAARQEWQAAGEEERPTLMRAAEEAVDPWRGVEIADEPEPGEAR